MNCIYEFIYQKSSYLSKYLRNFYNFYSKNVSNL